MDYRGEIVIFRNEDGEVNVQIDAVNETIWATQKSMAELFGVQRPAITKHLANIFADGELNEDSVSSILEHTAEDGKTYKVQFYNLDAKPSYINRNWVLKKISKTLLESLMFSRTCSVA